jgi:hypothetical protein
MNVRSKASHKLAAIVIGGALLLGAAGGTAQASPDTTSAKKTDDTTAFCAVFQGIADHAAATGGKPNGGPTGRGPSEPTTKAGWDDRIKRTAKIVKTAPADYKDEARTYLRLVKDRAKLAADNGYVSVADLPADVRSAFIADHIDEQQQANKLIAFAKTECNLA